LPSSYLLTYFIAVVIAAAAWHQLSLKDWINFGICWKNLLSHFRPWPWVCGIRLGLACLWPWLAGHGLGLDTSGLVNIPETTLNQSMLKEG